MMAYQSEMVVSIIVNGKPVREFNYNGQRTCRIPFGSEYKIKLKNKSNQRVLVSIDIDGTDILNFKQLIISPNSNIELERFIDNLDRGKKFKFISLEEGIRTGEIQDPTNKENGIITVRFYREKIFIKNPIFRGNSDIIYTSASASCYTGATVEGSESNQQFNIDNTHFETESTPIELSIKLIGINLREKFGIFLNNNRKPSYEFNDRIEAFEFAKMNDFGDSSVSIKKVL